MICRGWERIVTVSKVTFQGTEKLWDSHDGLMVDRDFGVLWKEAAVDSLGLCSSISLGGLRKRSWNRDTNLRALECKTGILITQPLDSVPLF